VNTLILVALAAAGCTTATGSWVGARSDTGESGSTTGAGDPDGDGGCSFDLSFSSESIA
jgi:hypothetical protein